MNHLTATYVDLVQGIGFVSLLILSIFISRKLFLDTKQDNFIEVVKIEVEE